MSESTAKGPNTQQSAETHQEFDITVSLRSAKKAERNDPKPLSVLRREWQQALGEPAIGDTENPPGPDAAQRSTSAARPDLASRQQSAQDDSAVGPAPTENPRHSSQEGTSDENSE